MQTPMEKREGFTDRQVGPEGVALSVPSRPVCQDVGGITGVKEIFVVVVVGPLEWHLSPEID